MGFFVSNSPYDAEVDKATNEKNTTEQWDVIIDICDKVKLNPKSAKDCLKSIMRRLGNDDPHVALQAITLLNACINNCGTHFHLEVASRDFETEFRKLLAKTQMAVAIKMKICLKEWAETVFKTDPQLNLIPSLYRKLKDEGQDFSDPTAQTVKQQQSLSKDPNVVSSQQEEDDIAKAIELSLRDKDGSPKTTRPYSSSMYPTMPLNDSGGAASAPTSSLSSVSRSTASEQRKVRALYDFEAAEDNELTFLAGEIIHVIDDSDPNWWKGCNHRGEGLFPSNFVSADLSVEPESLLLDNKNKLSVQFEDQKKETEPELVEINEEKMDRLLHLLHEANPEDPSQDSYEMLQLEAQVNQMLPLIDMELERVDRRHAQLTQLSKDLVEANNLYHSLMRDPDRPIGAGVGGSGFIPYPAGSMPQSIYGQIGAGGLYSMPNVYGIGQNIGPSSLPTSIPLAIIGQQQQSQQQHPMQVIPMQNYPIIGQQQYQQPTSSMIPQHLQNGHQSLSNAVTHSLQQPTNLHQQHTQQQRASTNINQTIHGLPMVQQLPAATAMPESNMPNTNIPQTIIPQLSSSSSPSNQTLSSHVASNPTANHHQHFNNNIGNVPLNTYQMVPISTSNFQNIPMNLIPGSGQNMLPPNINMNMTQQSSQQQPNMHFNHPQQHGALPAQQHQPAPQSQVHQSVGHIVPNPNVNNVALHHQHMFPATTMLNQPVMTNNSTTFQSIDSRANFPIYQQQR